jgi:RHS repeat-associated protein
MNRIVRVLCLLLVSCGSLAFAQNLGTGLYAFGSFDSRGFDSINLGNLNEHFEIPIVSKPGRGTNFSYSLAYDGLIWSSSSTTGTGTWMPNANWGFYGELVGGAYTGYLSYSQLTQTCPQAGLSHPPPGFILTNYVYHDAFGKNHRFNLTENFCPSTGLTHAGNGSTSDGSGLSYGGPNLSSGSSDGKVHTRSGSIINAPTGTASGVVSTITDSNGNEVTNNGTGTFTDTLGVTALTIGGSGTPASPLTLTYPVTLQPNGATSATATIAYKAYTVQTNFGCSGITEYGATSVNLIDHITLADGQSTYSFAYEVTPGVSGAVTGRLGSITLPTGGVISYTYTNGCNGNGLNADGTLGGLKRTTSDGTRTYGRVEINSNATTTNLTDETGNASIYDFSFVNSLFYETHRQIYQGSASGTPLQEQFTCYNSTSASCDGTAIVPPIAQITTTNRYNGDQALTVQNTYDAAGMLTGSTSAVNGSALMSTTNTYNTLEEVTSTTQRDSSGTAFKYSYYNYDENTPAATSNIPQHLAASGTRGNLTSTHVSAGATYLVTTTAYYDTGMPVSTTTPDGTTRYTYDLTQTFATTTTLPTPSSGVPLATSATYDQQSGALTSLTGMNSGQTVQITQYDGLLRPTAVTLPNTGTVSLSYSATQTGVNQTMGNGASTSTQTLLDPYGRTSRVAVFNGQSSNPWYQVDYCYDVTGLLKFQSTRYQGNGWGTPKQCSGNGTSYLYDALGRITSSSNPDGTSSYQYAGRATKVTDVNGIQKITQYDLLGRISGVCEISSNSLVGSGSPSLCFAANIAGGTTTPMEISGTGYSTTYAYTLADPFVTTITQGAQTRIVQKDPAGRTILVTEPERGTTTYSYVYNSTGLGVTRTRPKANQTSTTAFTTTQTQYDSVGRVVSITYSDGTSAKTFNYDTSTGWNFSQTNIKGQLTTAYVSNSTSAFSYDPMGNVIGMQSCEPSTCGNASAARPGRNFSYDLAGNLTSSSDGASGNIVYGRSPAGEVTSITNQSYTDIYNAPNLVSSVTNGPNGPLGYTLGNGLYSTLTYDTSGRLGGTWVCSGSLTGAGQPYCGSNTQIYGTDLTRKDVRITSSCDTVVGCLSYGYDEFNRLNAESGPASFTYGYDRWGNRLNQTVTQGSGPSPQLSVDPTSNRITATSGYAYDAAGNLTSDGAHSYTYDAEGNLLAVDGGTTAQYVYDALNRRVRQQTASGTYEYLFDSAGRRTSRWNVSNNSGDEGRIYWGGKQIAFRSFDGTTYFEHQDPIGTERVRTNYAGAVASSYASLPWGDGYSSPATPPWSNQDTLHFAQLDHDSESNTDHAQFRQYSNTQGRWMSPDPYDGSYDATNPQSLNRYSYVLNNPLSSIDLFGLDPCDPKDPNCYNVTSTPIGVDLPPPWYLTEYGGPSSPGWGSLLPPGFTLAPLKITPVPDAPNNGPTCTGTGNAPAPSYYAQKGQAASSNALSDLYNLYSFRRGGALDAQVGPGPNGQPFGGTPSYANYTFGVYMAAAGYTLNQTLAGADIYAQYRSSYPAGTPMAGPNYPFTPQTNVNNITNGFNAQTNGTTCHKPG